jgi:hypothetical protein
MPNSIKVALVCVGEFLLQNFLQGCNIFLKQQTVAIGRSICYLGIVIFE